jgi:acetolactate synthase-1/2/3 large subunit
LPTVSDAIIQELVKSGVDHFFLVVGGNAMYLDEAIRASGIPFTAFHHEQSAAMAAESYARLNGKVSVCVATSGPGASNLLTGIAGAYYDSVPVIFLSGQPKSTELRTASMPKGVRQVGTFELPMALIAEGVTKKSAVLNDPSQALILLKEMLSLAKTGRPGPVLIELPVDIQGASFESSSTDEVDRTFIPPTREIANFLDLFASKLSNSSEPLIAIGHGVRAAGEVEALRDILSLLGIPIVTTQLAKDFISYDDPLFVGHFGIRGDRAGNFAIQECDLLLTIGTSLHQQNIGYEPDLFAPNAEKFVVEYEGSVSGKGNFKDAFFLDTDLPLFIREFSSRSLTSNEGSWVRLNVARKSKYASENEPHLFTESPINMYDFIFALAAASGETDVIVTDAGLCFYIMGQAFKVKGNQRYIVSGGLGSMGYALPAAIGLSLGANRRVIAVTGDGSMQMNVQEIATLSLKQSNTNIFIINNGGYASIRNTQQSFFGGGFIGTSPESGVVFPNWRLIANAYGIKYFAISSNVAMVDQIHSILNVDAPKIIEVVAQQVQVVMPGVGSYRDSDGVLRSHSLADMSPKLAEDSGSNPLEFN